MTPQILVPIHTFLGGNSDSLVRHVVGAARHLGAEVHALTCVATFPRVHNRLASYLIDAPAVIAEVRTRSSSQGQALCGTLRSELAAAGITLEVQTAECFPGSFGGTVAARARLSDLVMVGIVRDDLEIARTAEAAIFGSGRPVLLVPEAEAPGGLDHVAIAWDGSAVAARAVADARDFLQRARRVSVVTILGEKPLAGMVSGEQLAGYLGRHGVTAEVACVQSDGRPVAEVLQAHMHEIGGNLLVMGAFGHSRLRDFVLGGATQGILRGLKVAALLSH